MTDTKTTEQTKAVYDSMVRKFGATSPHTADARDKFMEIVTVELAHREALAEEAKRNKEAIFESAINKAFQHPLDPINAAVLDAAVLEADHIKALAEAQQLNGKQE